MSASTNGSKIFAKSTFLTLHFCEMKIFTAGQIYEADKFTIEKQGITSGDLMERAAVGIFEWIHNRLEGASVKIQLFCGTGNNGGDGMALARYLFDGGYDIDVHVVDYGGKRSTDFLLNLKRLKERKISPHFIDSSCTLPGISTDDIVVDAIFGIGLSRTPNDWVGKLMEHINDSLAFVVSVDVPSGLPLNHVPWEVDKVVQSNYVLSFQVPKLVFFLSETGKYLENWELLDIGLDGEYMQNTATEYELMGKTEILPIYRSRDRFSHKGTYGHCLIVGGSYGKIGAVQLAGKACLRSGSGLVTLFVPKCGYHALQSSFPEAMVLTDAGEGHITEVTLPFKPSAIGLGIGLGTHGETILAIKDFLKRARVPMVIDADGLNILAKHPEILVNLPKGCVLTPHPKELERLMGKWTDDFDKLEKAKGFSVQYGCILVIKGACTIVVDGGKGYINPTGNSGMATAGSGDVLAGMITGLLAQGYTPLQSALLGVYLHGLAADLEVDKMGPEALLASDIIANIGFAYGELLAMSVR